MSIKLRFEKGSMVMQAVLKDEALNGLLALIEVNQSDEPISESPVPLGAPSIVHPISTQPVGDRIVSTRDWLAKHSSSELLNMFQWETYPEKILLLGAFHESSGGGEGWRNADINARFSEAKEPAPSNFPRDISKAIQLGLVSTVTPRTYKVSRTGWNKISEISAKLGAI